MNTNKCSSSDEANCKRLDLEPSDILQMRRKLDEMRTMRRHGEIEIEIQLIGSFFSFCYGFFCEHGTDNGNSPT